MIKTFPFRLDIEKEYNNRMYSVNSNDLKTVKFTFVVTDNGIPLDLTGLTVRIAIRKPDKKAVWQDCTITNAPKGEVEVILDNQAYVKKGEHEAELMLYKGTNTVAITQKFYYRAAEGIMSDKSLKSETVLGPIDQKLTEVEDIVKDLRENGTGIDAQARQDIESVTTQLAETSSVMLQTNPRGAIHQTKMVAHRGLSFIAPENTIPAIYEASKSGFFGVEIDFQLTQDGQWVAIHDDTVDRTTDGTGNVSSMTLSQIKSLDAGSWKHSVYTGTRIPTLGEVLKACRSTGLVPYIEIKKVCTMPEIISLLTEINKYIDSKDCVIISVYEQNVLYIREHDKNIALGLVQGITEAFIARVKQLGNAFLDAPYTDILDPNKLTLARQNGIDLDAWTVDDYQTCTKLANAGVKGITTNKIPFLGGL